MSRDHCIALCRGALDRARAAFIRGEVPSLPETAGLADLSEGVVVEAAGREAWCLWRHVHLGPLFGLFGLACCAVQTYCSRCREVCERAGVIDLAAVREARRSL